MAEWRRQLESSHRAVPGQLKARWDVRISKNDDSGRMGRVTLGQELASLRNEQT